MNYTIEEIIELKPPQLKNDITQIETFKIQESFNGLNNQNRITWEFMKSKYYAKHNRVKDFNQRIKDSLRFNKLWEKQVCLYHIAQDGNHRLDKKIRKLYYKSITFSDLEPYFEYLAWHLSVDVTIKNPEVNPYFKIPCRWGFDRQYTIQPQIDSWNQLISDIKILKQCINESDFDYGELKMDYHNFLSNSWDLIQIGLGGIALEVIKPLKELLNIYPTNTRTALSYISDATSGNYTLRYTLSVNLIMYSAYMQLKDEENAYKCLEEIIKLYDKIGCEHYNVTNRVVETAVLMYTLKPTLKNKLKCLEIFHYNCTLFQDEPTECARERGLIIFDLAKKIFKEDYEKYNS